MKSAEERVLRFLHTASSHERWVSYQIILNTQDLLPGDEKALPMLMWRGLVEERVAQAAYRLSEIGHEAVTRTSHSQRH